MGIEAGIDDLRAKEFDEIFDQPLRVHAKGKHIKRNEIIRTFS